MYISQLEDEAAVILQSLMPRTAMTKRLWQL